MKSIDLIKYIKDFPYWDHFKMQTWYFFHPVAHFKEGMDHIGLDIHEEIKAFKRKRNEIKKQNMDLEKEKRD